MPHAKPTPFSIGIIDWDYIRESLFSIGTICFLKSIMGLPYRVAWDWAWVASL